MECLAAFAGNLEKRGPGFIPGPPSLSRKPVYGLCVGRGSRQIEEDGICHAISDFIAMGQYTPRHFPTEHRIQMSRR